MPPKRQQKGVTVSATRRSTRADGRATVSGSNTPGATAKVTKTVGGSAKKIAAKRVRVGRNSVVETLTTSRQRDFSNCSEEATDRPRSTTRRNQLRSSSTAAIFDGSTSSDEVSDNERNAELSPQGREPGNVGISGRADQYSDCSKHTKASRSRLGTDGMSDARSNLSSVNMGD